jgi:hypothetical protein
MNVTCPLCRGTRYVRRLAWTTSTIWQESAPREETGATLCPKCLGDGTIVQAGAHTGATNTAVQP